MKLTVEVSHLRYEPSLREFHQWVQGCVPKNMPFCFTLCKYCRFIAYSIVIIYVLVTNDCDLEMANSMLVQVNNVRAINISNGLVAGDIVGNQRTSQDEHLRRQP